jgi:hypothetical protein
MGTGNSLARVKVAGVQAENRARYLTKTSLERYCNSILLGLRFVQSNTRDHLLVGGTWIESYMGYRTSARGQIY